MSSLPRSHHSFPPLFILLSFPPILYPSLPTYLLPFLLASIPAFHSALLSSLPPFSLSTSFPPKLLPSPTPSFPSFHFSSFLKFSPSFCIAFYPSSDTLPASFSLASAAEEAARRRRPHKLPPTATRGVGVACKRGKLHLVKLNKSQLKRV